MTRTIRCTYTSSRLKLLTGAHSQAAVAFSKTRPKGTTNQPGDTQEHVCCISCQAVPAALPLLAVPCLCGYQWVKGGSHIVEERIKKSLAEGARIPKLRARVQPTATPIEVLH